MTESNFVVNFRVADSEHFEVRLGEELRTGDLYYLGIDPRTTDHDCSVEDGLRKLLSGWISTLLNADDRTIFYLPFDFSDEFTRWLACEKHGDQVTVVFGWAEVEGWSFSPSDFSDYAGNLQDFRADEPVDPQTFYLPRMLSNLRSCRAKIAGSASVDAG